MAPSHDTNKATLVSRAKFESELKNELDDTAGRVYEELFQMSCEYDRILIAPEVKQNPNRKKMEEGMGMPRMKTVDDGRMGRNKRRKTPFVKGTSAKSEEENVACELDTSITMRVAPTTLPYLTCCWYDTCLVCVHCRKSGDFMCLDHMRKFYLGKYLL